jgi:hypothetical protein
MSKKYVEKGADMLLMKCAKKNKTRAPHDVLRREAILDEHAITKRQGGRRISTVFQNKGGDGGRSDIELTVINDDQQNVNDAVGSFSNPMRRNNTNPVGRRRRSSAPSAFVAPPPSPRRGGAPFTMEERMEQLMRDNIEMKKQLQKLSQKVLGSRTGKTTHGAKTTTTTTQRTKRLSKVMKARRNSHSTKLPVVDPTEVHVDAATGRRYSVNMNTGESTWLDEEGEGVPL